VIVAPPASDDGALKGARVLDLTRPYSGPVSTLIRALLGAGVIRSDPQIGPFVIPGSPVRFSAWSDNPELRADLLGEHNEEVLREAGLTNEDIAQLYSENVVVRDALLNTPAE
jgi:crotonobetainyl-CoA:carnitine CoA-transferase CaiB-like acyl-CoA transferase